MAKPTFLTLPAEIRQRVLGHVFEGSTIALRVILQPSIIPSASDIVKTKSKSYATTPSVLLTCKQILAEGHILYWQHSEVVFQLFESHLTGDMAKRLRLGDTVPPYFKHAHTVSLDIINYELAAAVLNLLPRFKILDLGSFAVMTEQEEPVSSPSFAEVRGRLAMRHRVIADTVLRNVKSVSSVVGKLSIHSTFKDIDKPRSVRWAPFTVGNAADYHHRSGALASTSPLKRSCQSGWKLHKAC